MRSATVLALAVSLAMQSAPARAEESVPTRWYGWQIMLVDLGVVTTLGIGAGGSSEAVAGLGLGAFVLGGPIVHFAHDEPGHGALSLLLRGGLPFALGITAGALCDSSGGSDEEDWFPCLGEVGAAVFGGVVLAMVIDYALLSREPDPERPAALHMAVTPRREGGVTVGLMGSF